MSPPPDAGEVECISLSSRRGEHGAWTLQSLGQGDHGHRQGGSVSVTPSGFSSADDRALEESQSRVWFFPSFLFFNSSFHSDQLMEDRLRRPPRISSDLQVREAGKCCPALVPGTGLDTGAGKGPAAACLDTGTQPGLSDSVFNGVKSTWFVYFSFNLGHFVSLSENVT